MTRLVGSVAGPSLQIDNNSANANGSALDLQVEPGKAPMKVNSDAQVANLNSDKVDGKSANEIGVNGLERVSLASALNSNSVKTATVFCPAGKVVVGTGAEINGGKSGASPNEETDVVLDDVIPSTNLAGVGVAAYEDEPTSTNWSVTAIAICATAP